MKPGQDKTMEFLKEYLRINAIRRMLTIVDVKTGEIVRLIFFAVLFAMFEGAGLSLLLPILQYAEGGQKAALGGAFGVVGRVMMSIGIPPTLLTLLVLAFIPILLRQVVYYCNAWYSAVVSSRIGIRMRMQTLDTILDADPEFYTRNPMGKIVGIVVNQTGIAGLAILAVINQLSITLLMLLYVVILFAISAPLTLSVVIFAATVSVMIRATIKKTRKAGMEAGLVVQELYAKVWERLALIRLIKLRDQKRDESKRIERYSETQRLIGVRLARLGASVEVTADPMLMLSVFVTLFLGITFLHMTLAELGLLLFVLNRLNAKVKEFNAARQAISTNMAGLLLVKEMADDAEASNTIRSGEVPFEGLSREIVLSDVRFVYPDTVTAAGETTSSGKTVLDGISLTIPAGSFTAIVGRSGSGKSTLVELLPRLRDAGAGIITFDGEDVKRFELGSLRRGIGYLTQNAMLFNETVRENLVYGLGSEPTDEQLRAALEGAYATFVYDLPEGLETNLGEQGVRFSGGEKQRIALARVLLEDCSVLILDEPTSSLDSESEAFIQKALAKLHGRKTLIVIAHRLATVVQADQLLVMDEGCIVEHGTHTELLAATGAYQKLFESQLLL